MGNVILLFFVITIIIVIELCILLCDMSVSGFQEEMKCALNTLQEKWDVFDKMKSSFESTVDHIKVSCLGVR